MNYMKLEMLMDPSLESKYKSLMSRIEPKPAPALDLSASGLESFGNTQAHNHNLPIEEPKTAKSVQDEALRQLYD
jgi:hypothetical protein